MLRATFLGFQTASSALNASQRMLDVTGQNMANVNTIGFSRQRVDLYATSFGNNNSRYSSKNTHPGYGVQVGNISQSRDPFLDVRYRREAAKTGNQDIMLDGLNQLETVFDEISKEGFNVQVSSLIEQLQKYSQNASDPVIEGVVKTSASMLCQLFNNYSNQINSVKEQQLNNLNQQAIPHVNQLLDNIANLNKQIKEDNINGSPALELSDKRNLLIDELSGYLNIEVSKNKVDIGEGRNVEELLIKLKDNSVILVKDSSFSNLDIDISDEKNIKIFLGNSLDTTTFPEGMELTKDIKEGQIAGYLDFLNSKGEFGKISSTNRGIQYYDGMLNSLASKLSEVMNSCNKSLKVDADGNALDEKGFITTNPSEYVYEDKPLFESKDGGDITAGNIKIAENWFNSKETYITNTKLPSKGGDNSLANDNILKMISLFKQDLDFKYEDGTADGRLDRKSVV